MIFQNIYFLKLIQSSRISVYEYDMTLLYWWN